MLSIFLKSNSKLREVRFGLSKTTGCNYVLSVTYYVMQHERVFKINGLLCLYTYF